VTDALAFCVIVRSNKVADAFVISILIVVAFAVFESETNVNAFVFKIEVVLILVDCIHALNVTGYKLDGRW
jgi:hypothetical protein